MAQAFVSTYKNHFRWNTQPRAKIIDPDALTKLKPEGDIWLLDPNEALERELRNIAKIEKAINKLYLNRTKTTYQVSYCENIKPVKKHPHSLLSKLNLKTAVEGARKEDEPKAEIDQDIGNELLEYCKKIYAPRTNRITPPLNSSRNVFGYMRPARLLTPLTVYQNEYGKVGFNVLLRAADNERLV